MPILPLNLKPSVYGLLVETNPALANYFDLHFPVSVLPPNDAVRQVNHWWRMLLASLPIDTLQIRLLLDDTMGATEWTINFRRRVIPLLNQLPDAYWSTNQ